jgi:signal transduction histidine kinase
VRSLFTKILLWFVATTLVSLAALVATSTFLVARFGPHDFFAQTIALQIDDARLAYEEGGPTRLSSYLHRLDTFYPVEHFLTDSRGRDLVSGIDRSPLLARAETSPMPFRPWGDRLAIVHDTNDGRYRLVAVIEPQQRIWSFLPFYLWILLVIAFLCYVLAVHLARPLRSLRRTVERFGRGDLSARTRSTRRDEIGDLSRAFDRMGERIETLLNAERRLLLDVSHELRTPLARLRFAVELARTSDDREKALGRIRKDVDRLATLVDELLQLTQSEGDPSSVKPVSTPLHELLRSLVDDCAVEAEMQRCELVLEIDRPVTVRGERELLRRAVENVLRNAIRHSPEGSAVEIGLGLDSGMVTIRVRDHGPGVPEESLESIFEPFYRLGVDRGRSSGGVGLGLSIARRAVHLHQGRVGARNALPGLIVTIELPCPTLQYEEDCNHSELMTVESVETTIHPIRRDSLSDRSGRVR